MGIRSAGRTSGADERCVADEAEICIDVFVKPFDRRLTTRTAAVGRWGWRRHRTAGCDHRGSASVLDSDRVLNQSVTVRPDR